MVKDVKVILNKEDKILHGKFINDKLYIEATPLFDGLNWYGTWVKEFDTYKVSYSNVRVREMSEYDFKGIYLNFDKISVEKWNVSFDEKGIPKTNFRWGTYHYPITIAHYGLQHHGLYLISNQEVNKQIFLKVADWLLENQNENGSWASYFDHMYYKGRTQVMNSPWCSSLGQGLSISVLTRAFHITGERKYLDSALEGFKIYAIPVENGGVLRRFENEYLFYEEYPTEPASYVLNGFIYSLLGLYDLYKTSNDVLVEFYFLEGLKTLKRMLPLYDLGNRTAYDLTHYTTDGGFPNVARWGYHVTHVHLLMAVYAIDQDPKVKTILNRWIDYIDGKTVREN
ncbi:D-glucuronyl C5-epimerase family protein [Neobacillus sp. KR4-4]|uniref:D-glucuronyl C5-epimerase family protein n=1 Tax=Neobacillus sp. KR4-4 TaxID=3344872 RepID=UPI0035CB916C